MQSSQSFPLNDQHRERDVVARDLDAERDSLDRRTSGARKGSEYYAGSSPVEPPTRATQRYPGGNNSHFASIRPSISRRILRALARFFFAALIGVGATLAWQSYSDDAKEMIRARAPSLGWLLPARTQSSTPAAVFPELAQQLKPMAVDLALVRRSVEQLAANQDQLAAKQEQMAQNMATLQEVEQDVRQKILSPPATPAVHIPPRKPLPPPPAPSSAVQPSSVPPPPPPAAQPAR